MRQDGGHGLSGRAARRRSSSRSASPSSPETAIAPASVSADLDGDGTAETVTASPSRGGIRVQVADARGRRIAEARAPSPAGDVVPFTLTTAPIGSAGALLEVRRVDRRLGVRLGLEAARPRSRARADPRRVGPCAARLRAAGLDAGDGSPTAGKPSELVRERSQKVDDGTLVTREAFAFAGFSLDAVAARSGAEINGVPIPAWYPETLFTRTCPGDALQPLRPRRDAQGAGALDRDRRRPRRVRPPVSHPGLGHGARRSRRQLRRLRRRRDARARRRARRPRTSRSASPAPACPSRSRSRVEGLGAPYDQRYAPAGSWRGGRASGVPSAPPTRSPRSSSRASGSRRRASAPSMEVEGEGPYRIRSGSSVLVPDVAAAAPPVDLLLRPAGGLRRRMGRDPPRPQRDGPVPLPLRVRRIPLCLRGLAGDPAAGRARASTSGRPGPGAAERRSGRPTC